MRPRPRPPAPREGRSAPGARPTSTAARRQRSSAPGHFDPTASHRCQAERMHSGLWVHCARMSEQATPTSRRSQENHEPDYGRFYYGHDCGIPYERNDHWLRVLRQDRRGDRRATCAPPRSSTPAARWASWSRRCAPAGSRPGASTSPSTRSPRSTSRCAEYCRVGSLAEPLPTPLRPDRHASRCWSTSPPTEADPPRSPTSAPPATGSCSRRPPTTTARRPTSTCSRPRPGRPTLAREGFLRDVDRDVSYVDPVDRPLQPPRGAAGGDGQPLRPRLGPPPRARPTSCADSLLAAQERHGRARGPAGRPRAAELLAELDRRNEEILRLRDLLIGKDAELGAAKGRSRGDRRSRQAARLRQASRGRTAAPDLRQGWSGPRPAHAPRPAAAQPWLPRASRSSPRSTKRRPDVLRKMLRSVRRQSFDDWELCLVDDGSQQPHVREILERGRGGRPADPGRAPRGQRRHRRRLQRRPGDGTGASSSPCSTTTTSLHPDALALRRRGDRRRPRSRLRLHRRGQDRPAPAATRRRSSSPTGRRSGCGPRCTPATSASSAAPWSRRSVASTPSSRAPRTGTWCSGSPSRRARSSTCPEVLYHWRHARRPRRPAAASRPSPGRFEAGERAVAGALRAHRPAGRGRARLAPTRASAPAAEARATSRWSAS